MAAGFRFRSPSAAVLGARARRDSRAGRSSERTEWFIKEVSARMDLTVKQRVMIATEFVKNKVVKNISIPVTKGLGGQVIERSKPGEFPRADTTLLMKTIFTDIRRAGNGIWDGFIGSPLDYSLSLELQMKRQHLSRTLNEERSRIRRILTAKIRG